MDTETETRTEYRKTPDRPYTNSTLTTEVGESIEVPYHAVGITISRVAPFSDAVVVSYMERPDANPNGGANDLVVRVAEIPDDAPTFLPYYAVGITVDDEDDRVYYLT